MQIINIDKSQLAEDFKVLVLEDNATRNKWFKPRLIGLNVHYTDNATDALELIKNNDYNLLFLDHDLGGKQMVAITEFNTGSTVARALKDKGGYENAQIIIHSHNPGGSYNMSNLLKGSVWIPFGMFDINII